MLDLEQGLLTRRSCRRFIKNRAIPPKDINEILKVTMHAPSARNSQCWEFVVIDDKAKFAKIMEIHPYASFLKDASLAVIVCGNTKLQMDKDYWIVDTSAATMYMLLAAHARGIGGCWCGIYPDAERMKQFANFLSLPPHVQPLSMVVLGYKSEEPAQPQNRYSATKVHNNNW